jgi:hypothetical protein
MTCAWALPKLLAPMRMAKAFFAEAFYGAGLP